MIEELKAEKHTSELEDSEIKYMMTQSQVQSPASYQEVTQPTMSENMLVCIYF